MSTIDKMITTDVLVVGGGFGGLICGIKMKEGGANVLIAEKATASGGGGATRAGNGIIAIPKTEEAIEAYVEYHARNIGEYVDNQDMVRQIAGCMEETLQELIDWGVKITTDENGKAYLYPTAGTAPWGMTGIEMNCNISLRRKANKVGVEFLEHFQVTGLLKDGDRIAGAVGFDIYDGSFVVIQAKAVVIATGGTHYKNVSMFVGCGEGNKMAFDAGATMRSAEFGNSYEVYALDKGNTIYGTYPFIHNGKGENMWDKYVTWPAPAPTKEFWRGFANEYIAGNGPMYVDLEEFRIAMETDEEWRYMGQSYMTGPQEGTNMVRIFPDKMKFTQIFDDREHEYVHMTDKPEVKIALHGNTGCIKVGLDFQTNVPGLYAIGIESWNGSGSGGAVGHPGMQKGNGLGHAAFSAHLCAPHVVENLKGTELPKLDEAQIAKLREATFKPYEREEGFDPHDMIEEIQDCITPVKYNCLREEGRMEEAIQKLSELRESKLENLKAKDWHDLKIAHEIRAMALTGEMVLRSGLIRKESRGTHIREDYTELDNTNWLKWICIDNVDGQMSVYTEDVPIDQYKYRPDNA